MCSSSNVIRAIERWVGRASRNNGTENTYTQILNYPTLQSITLFLLMQNKFRALSSEIQQSTDWIQWHLNRKISF
jgi:hypothetical protein